VALYESNLNLYITVLKNAPSNQESLTINFLPGCKKTKLSLVLKVKRLEL
jgi:hypothetical protein